MTEINRGGTASPQTPEGGPEEQLAGGGNLQSAEPPSLSHLRHELRTPLNAVIGYSEMLLEDAGDWQGGRFLPALEGILARGQELLALVNDLLQPTGKEGGETGGVPARVTRLGTVLAPPAREIRELAEKLLEEAEALPSEEALPDLRKIHVAAGRFLDLLSPCLDHPPQEAAVPSASSMPPAPPSLSQESQVPAAPADSESIAGMTGNGALLVVDDNDLNRDLLARHLERQGHRVRMAADGRQALEIIRIEHLDLVLLDIMMPEMDGFEVLQRLKSHQDWRNLPVIMISALDEMESVVRCIEMGAEDYLPKPFDPILLKARIGACLEKKRLHDREIEHLRQLQQLNESLELRNRFIRRIFGRYLSEEIVAGILESPEGLKLGGENLRVTLMLSDLRGFTTISERLHPEEVVALINNYLETMTEIITRHQGTIAEFIGDAILVIFGAPMRREDDAYRAVACALEMQLAMDGVNVWNRAQGYPEVAMGIGLNTGEVVVGNIGSKLRTKYGVVGRHVNLTSRIESFTVGGQILASESTIQNCGSILRLDDATEIRPKGVKGPLTVYEVGGIGGDFNLYLPPKKSPQLLDLPQPLPVRLEVLSGKFAGPHLQDGQITALGPGAAAVRAELEPEKLDNLRIVLIDQQGRVVTRELYAKVTQVRQSCPSDFLAVFTAVPPEAGAFLEKMLDAQGKRP
jgi:adenylate cyclase